MKITGLSQLHPYNAVLQIIYKSYDNLLYTKFSKAFDRVNHSNLLFKLKRLGIDEMLIDKKKNRIRMALCG